MFWFFSIFFQGGKREEFQFANLKEPETHTPPTSGGGSEISLRVSDSESSNSNSSGMEQITPPALTNSSNSNRNSMRGGISLGVNLNQLMSVRLKKTG